MLSAFVNTFKITELRQRILFTFGLIFICRVIAAVPLPGVDALAIRSFIEAQGGAQGAQGQLGGPDAARVRAPRRHARTGWLNDTLRI